MARSRAAVSTHSVLFVTTSGPRKGDPDCRAAFRTKDEAVQFLVDLHGLSVQEAKKLKLSLKLRLKRAQHGSEQCLVEPELMDGATAKKALSGELYLPEPEIVPKVRAKKPTVKVGTARKNRRSA